MITKYDSDAPDPKDLADGLTKNRDTKKQQQKTVTKTDGSQNQTSTN
jgi:hypothetical protein